MIRNTAALIPVLALVIFTGCGSLDLKRERLKTRSVQEVVGRYEQTLTLEQAVDAVDVEAQEHPDRDVDHRFTIKSAMIGERCQLEALQFRDAIAALSETTIAEAKTALDRSIRTRGLGVHSVPGLELVFSEDELVALIRDPRTRLTHCWKSCGPGSFGIKSMRVFAAAELAK